MDVENFPEFPTPKMSQKGEGVPDTTFIELAQHQIQIAYSDTLLTNSHHDIIILCDSLFSEWITSNDSVITLYLCCIYELCSVNQKRIQNRISRNYYNKF